MKAKFILTVLFLNVCFITVFSQSFEWAKRAGLYAFDLGYGVGCDDAGNVYISGKYEMNAYFGGTYVGCAGNHDIYVAKYGSDGSFKWVRTAGGRGGDYAHAMTCDGAGNVYTTGEMEMTVYFGSVSLSSWGSNDVFIAKYNTNGVLQWAKRLGGGGGNDKGLGISQINGNIYVTGFFSGSANFSGTTLYSSGGLDIFVVKYNSAGVFQWARKAGGSSDDEGYAISNDPSGNVYVTGYFRGTANFSGVTLSSSGANDIFIAKYNSSGTLIWVKKAGGSAADYGMGISAKIPGKVFLTGGFRTNSHFGALSLTASGGNADIFVASYNSATGDALWVRKAGGSANDYGRGLAVDANSNLYITGNYGNSATFGSTTISGADETEIYFASYSGSGNFRWVLKAGGVKDESDPNRFIEMGLSICVNNSNNVFASGAYRSNSTFGSTTLNQWDHTEIFLTKIRQGTKSSTENNETANGEDTSLSLSDTILPLIDSSLLAVKSDEPLFMDSTHTFNINIADGFVSQELNDSLVVKIYPNPNNGLFTIEINTIPNNENESVKMGVVNAVGQTVYQRDVSSDNGHSTERIELENALTPGIYFLKVTLGNRVENIRMILTK